MNESGEKMDDVFCDFDERVNAGVVVSAFFFCLVVAVTMRPITYPPLILIHPSNLPFPFIFQLIRSIKRGTEIVALGWLLDVVEVEDRDLTLDDDATTSTGHHLDYDNTVIKPNQLLIECIRSDVPRPKKAKLQTKLSTRLVGESTKRHPPPATARTSFDFAHLHDTIIFFFLQRLLYHFIISFSSLTRQTKLNRNHGYELNDARSTHEGSSGTDYFLIAYTIC